MRRQVFKKIEKLINDKLETSTRIITQWTSTASTLAFPSDSPQLLASAINTTSEEMLNYRLNILRSVDGHIFIGNEPFMKNWKQNWAQQPSTNNEV